MEIACFPRVRLGRQPTPLEPMENLSRVLGAPRLWIKRDDCTGLSTGGNKTRKLEFLMAEALARKADVITHGATQSKHARQTAAAAARLGILLEDRTGSTDPSYTGKGNALLDHVHGAAIERHSGGSDMQAESLRDQWNRPMTRDNPPTAAEKDDFRLRHQSSTVLSHLPRPTQMRRVPCLGGHGEEKKAFENTILHRNVRRVETAGALIQRTRPCRG